MKITRNLVGVCGALAALGGPGRALASNLVFNGGFELTNNPFNGALNGDKTPFVTAAPTGWSIGTGGLTFLCAPGTADDPAKYLAVWGPFPTSSGPGISGGNCVLQDGDPTYSRTISQMLTIPSAGLYEVTLDQAAGQQYLYNGTTTERWQVTLGSAGTQYTSLMSIASHGVNPWQSESLTFSVPSAGSYLLQLMAVGTPSGEPPISFIDNVGVSAVPAPATLAVIGVGLLGSAGRKRIRRARPSATSSEE